MLEKQKGFSFIQVIFATAIVAILSAGTIAASWGLIDRAKINTIVTLLKEQKTVFTKEPDYDYDALNINNDWNYLPEMVDAGLLSPIPVDLFEDPAALTWEIRKNTFDGYKVVYYTVLDSTNVADKALLDDAIARIGFSVQNINTIP